MTLQPCREEEAHSTLSYTSDLCLLPKCFKKCQWEIPHHTARSVKIFLPFCPHAGTLNPYIALFQTAETPKGHCFYWAEEKLYLILFHCVYAHLESVMQKLNSNEEVIFSVCLGIVVPCNDLTEATLLYSLVNVLLKDWPCANTDTLPGQYQIPLWGEVMAKTQSLVSLYYLGSSKIFSTQLLPLQPWHLCVGQQN